MRTNDPTVLEDSYQGYIKMIPKKPYPTLKGIQFMLDMLAEKMPQAKTAKPEQFVDLSFFKNWRKRASLTKWRSATRRNSKTKWAGVWKC